ncbi:MAG: plastocyanin, partial [Actinomycetota bacterium]|nr:plastocyanin [Actinomycetota bacterium]
KKEQDGVIPDGVQMVAGHQFSPKTITVTAGEALNFTNASAESHTVTAYEDSLPKGAEYFASGLALSEKEARNTLEGSLIGAGATFTVTLDKPGTYQYFCVPHESDGMKGTIVVLPKSSSP